MDGRVGVWVGGWVAEWVGGWVGGRVGEWMGEQVGGRVVGGWRVSSFSRHAGEVSGGCLGVLVFKCRGHAPSVCLDTIITMLTSEGTCPYTYLYTRYMWV